MKLFFQGCSLIILLAAAGTAFGQGRDDLAAYGQANATDLTSVFAGQFEIVPALADKAAKSRGITPSTWSARSTA
jgi:hypothetical protein